MVNKIQYNFTLKEWRGRVSSAEALCNLPHLSSFSQRVSDKYDVIDHLNYISNSPRELIDRSALLASAKVSVAKEREPSVLEGNQYNLIAMNAKTEISDFVSMRYGGIVFEDPAWAILFAFGNSISATNSLISASNSEDIWAIIQDNDQINRNFLTGSVDDSRKITMLPGKLSFYAIAISGKQVLRIRAKGAISFDGGYGPRFYEMYYKLR